MKAFLDLGAYQGDTLQIALKIFSNFDRFYLFEPFEESFKILTQKYGNQSNIIIRNEAASICSAKEKLYLHHEIERIPKRSQGNSLISSKRNVNQNSFTWVQSIDFSRFILETFKKSDQIILKIDIEGMEYSLLEKMIKDGSIAYIDKLYCEWHYMKIDLPKSQHDKIINDLQSLGFKISGDNDQDEFKKVMKAQAEPIISSDPSRGLGQS